MNEHFRLLGIRRDCSEEELKKAYHAKALEFHPDRNPKGTDMFKKIHTAYEAVHTLLKANGSRMGLNDKSTFPGSNGATRGSSKNDFFRGATRSFQHNKAPSSNSRDDFKFTDKELFESTVLGGWASTNKPSNPSFVNKNKYSTQYRGSSTYCPNSGGYSPSTSLRPPPAETTAKYTPCSNKPSTAPPPCTVNPTEALHLLSQDPHPNIHLVWACVDAGATLLFSGRPILNGFIANGAVAAVIACLTTTHPIDFTVVDDHLETPFHAVCRTDSDHDGYILLGLVDRLENSSTDRVDWAQKDGKQNLDFISYAALRGKLWLFWPMIKDSIPYFSTRAGPIEIDAMVFGWDWRRLSDVDQKRFKVLKGFKEY